LIAVAGAAMSLFAPPPEPSVAVTAMPPPRRAIEKPTKSEKQELDPELVRAQDEEDIIEIILAQIEATPDAIDDRWIMQMCRYVTNTDSLDAFWKQAVASGQAHSISYVSRNKKSGPVLSRNPLYYVFEAREFIYSTDPQENKLLGSAPGLLDMAIAKSFEASRKEIREAMAKEQRKKVQDVIVPEGMGSLDDEVRTTYFKEYLKLYAVVGDLASKNGGDPRRFIKEQIRLHEASIVDRHTRMMEIMSSARERYKGNTNSARPATVQMTRWSNAVDEQLLFSWQDLHQRRARGKGLPWSDAGVCGSRFHGAGHGLSAEQVWGGPARNARGQSYPAVQSLADGACCLEASQGACSSWTYC